MFKDGICHVEGDYYTKTIQFNDINYQLAKNEDKVWIFEKYCDLMNYFDNTLKIQFTFMNQTADMNEFIDSIDIPEQDDEFNHIRSEYAEMLKEQLTRGNNGLRKLKYITFGIEESDRKIAKNRLEHIGAQIVNNFKTMGVSATVLNGAERLEVLYRTFNLEHKDKFIFDWKSKLDSGLSTKDYIAPTSFNFGANSRMFSMGKTYGCVSYVDIIASELEDTILSDYLDMDCNIIVNMHLRGIDQSTAIKFIKKKLTSINAMKIDEQKKAARSGYDMDILPPDLVTYSEEIQKILKDLQSKNERMFIVTLTIVNFAESPKNLELLRNQTANLTQQNNCKLRPLDYQQENALMSAIPLGINRIEIERRLTTSSTAIFIPFTTQDLFMTGEPIYYGLNPLSSNMITADRKQLNNPNGLLLGTPGAGKSFSAKREISNVFLITTDDIIICDPEGEYYPLVRELGGQLIKISANSKHHINPMDINTNYSEDEDPITLKSDFILSLCELIIGGKHGLEATEKPIIDRCVRKVYTKYFADPKPENMPILEDLYNEILTSPEKEAKKIALALEIYVTGSLNLFNNRSNVDLNNRIICFDIKELGKQLRKLGMLVVQDQVWNRVTQNRGSKSTRYYIDEFHLLLKEEQTAAYSMEIWKRFRKWGGIPTGITQNVKDLLSSKEIENILDNSDFIYMLNQAPGDREILADKLKISEYQLSYVTNSNQGEGLIFFGKTILPFVDRFPKETTLYRIMTTKPEEQMTSSE